MIPGYTAVVGLVYILVAVTAIVLGVKKRDGAALLWTYAAVIAGTVALNALGEPNFVRFAIWTGIAALALVSHRNEARAERDRRLAAERRAHYPYR